MKTSARRMGDKANKGAQVFLNGKPVVLKGTTESKPGLSALSHAEELQRATSVALRLIGYRPRSEAELRKRLALRGFDAATQNEVLQNLKDMELVDDAAFARFWTSNRASFSPRSRLLTKTELRQKGIDNEAIDGAVSELDEEENAYRAALSKVRTLSLSDYEDYRRRLGSYLKRRGFTYRVITHTMQRVWQENRGAGVPPQTRRAPSGATPEVR